MMKRFIPLFLLVATLFSEDCIPKEDTVNTWYRLAPSDTSDSLENIPLNMSYGFVWADPLNVYILVFNNNTGEKILMTFTNGE